MTQRNFTPRENDGLERDIEGHRTGFKIYIKVRRPMSIDGFNRWGTKQKVHIGKSRFTWKYYSSSRALGYPNGVPIEAVKTNKAFGEWLINFAYLTEGEIYAIYSWRGMSKKKPIPVLTKPLMTIEVLNIEKLAFKISKDGRMSRYWFRIKDKPRGMRQ